jgi:hypothetical protein
VPTPIRTPLSKSSLLEASSQLRWFRMVQHSLIEEENEQNMNEFVKQNIDFLKFIC